MNCLLRERKTRAEEDKMANLNLSTELIQSNDDDDDYEFIEIFFYFSSFLFTPFSSYAFSLSLLYAMILVMLFTLNTVNTFKYIVKNL